MRWLVEVEFEKNHGWHTEYKKFADLEDAKNFADEKADYCDENCTAYSILIYEITTY